MAAQRAARALAALMLIALATWLAARVYTDWLWYREMDRTDVLHGVMWIRVALVFVPFALGTGGTMAGMWLARQLCHPSRRASHAHPLAPAFAALAGLGSCLPAIEKWQVPILWWHGGRWGWEDPHFGYDVGYFIFQWPFLSLMADVVTLALAFMLAGALSSAARNGALGRGEQRSVSLAPAILLAALAAALAASLTWTIVLSVHEFVVSERELLTGLDYTAANATLVARGIAGAGVALAWVAFVVFLKRPEGSVVPTFLAALAFLTLPTAHVYPALYRTLLVEPQELTREWPFIAHHLRMTRYGFALHDAAHAVFDVGDPDGRTEQYSTDAVPSDLRLWDTATARIAMQELEALAPQYRVGDVDVVRSVSAGRDETVLISAREAPDDALPVAHDRWIAWHVLYTHGSGLVIASGSATRASGLPTMLSEGDGTDGDGGDAAFALHEPRILFGEATGRFALLGTTWNSTLDRVEPDDDVVDPTPGVPINGLLARLAFALRLGDARLALTRITGPGSRIAIHRNVRERASRVAPFLRLDLNPYPAVVDGRLVWIIEGYTTSDMLPYSRRFDMDRMAWARPPVELASDLTRVTENGVRAHRNGVVNYVRNAAKVVVDALDGTVRVFAMPGKTPVLDAWRAAFPGVVEPINAASCELRTHFRYPETLFRAQAVAWERYHVDDPRSFYERSDDWRIPPDAAFIAARAERAAPAHETRRPSLRPRWLHAALPGLEGRPFALVQPFSPLARNTLAGLLAGVSGTVENEEGMPRLVSYRANVPGSLGPAQAQARIDQDADVSAWITLRMQSGSRVSRGELVILPVPGAVIYVQPLFVQADKSEVTTLLSAELSSIPELTKVVVVGPNGVTMGDDLVQALDGLRMTDRDEPGDEPPGGVDGTGATRPDRARDRKMAGFRRLVGQGGPC